MLDALIAKESVFVLFLPHSVEDDGSDIVAARHVVEQMDAGAGDYMILEEDCTARLLKGIIRECAFVVGERTHSLIASVSVATPFMALTNRRDTRTHGIIGEMCQCEHLVVDMDVENEPAAARRARELLASRASIRKVLEPVRVELSSRLLEIGQLVKRSSRVRPS